MSGFNTGLGGGLLGGGLTGQGNTDGLGGTPGLYAPPPTNEPVNRFEDEEETEWGALDTLVDIGMAPARGFLGAVAAVGNLFGADADSSEWVGESETMVGGFLEGVSQFIVGFAPGMWGLGHLGKVGKFAAYANRGGKFGRGLTSKVISKTAGAGAKVKNAKIIGNWDVGRATKEAAAGAFADFTIFDSNDPRLANLVEAIPGIEDPLSTYLAADLDADRGDLEERMKAAIEGVGLGVIAGGLLRMFGKLKWKNKRINEGAPKAEIEKINEDIGHEAVDLMETPVDDLSKASKELSDPDSLDTVRPEEEDAVPRSSEPDEGVMPDPLKIPKDARGDDILGDEFITPEQAKEAMSDRTAYDPDGGIVIIAEPGHATDQVIDAVMSYDSFQRTPGSRLQIIQMKKDAEIVPLMGSKVRSLTERKMPDESKAAYKNRLLQAAKDAGIDGVSEGRGKDKRVTVLQENGILNRVTVKSEEPFFVQRAAEAKIKIASIVGNSRVESGIMHMQLRPGDAVKVAKALKTVMDLPNKENLDKMRNIMNLSKVGERGQRAYYNILSQEIDYSKAYIDGKLPPGVAAQKDGEDYVPVTWDEAVERAHHDTAKIMGSDFKVLMAEADLHSDNVDSAARFAMGTRLWMDHQMTEVETLARHLLSWDDLDVNGKHVVDRKLLPTDDIDGATLSKEAAAEQLHRTIQSIKALGASVGRLGNAFGRGLNSFKISSARMTENALMRSLSNKAGGIEHILKTARKLKDMFDKNDKMFAANQIIHQTVGDRIKHFATDYYMFSLLSAPKTLTTNFIGAGFTAMFKPLEASIGSWVGKKLVDEKTALEFARVGRVNRRQITTLASMMMETASVITYLRKGKPLSQDTQQAVGMARRAYTSNEGQLGGGGTGDTAWLDGGGKEARSEIEALSKQTVGDYPEQGGMGASVQMFFSEFMKQPSKIMVSADEFIKQLSYLSHIRAELVEQANEHGLQAINLRGGPLSAEGWIDNEMRKMTMDGQAKTLKLVEEAARKEYPTDRFADPNVRAKHIQNYIENQLDDESDGSTVFNRSVLMQRALEGAKEVTFTTAIDKDAGPLSKFGAFLSELQEHHPMTKFIVPFVKTPLNILLYTGQRVPIPMLNKDMGSVIGGNAGIIQHVLAAGTRWSKKIEVPGVSHLNKMWESNIERSLNKWSQAITSPDAQIAAEAYGRATTAAAVLTAFMTSVGNADLFSGAGPADLEQRKVLMATGWAPYSVKVGDSWISYQKMDPFASMLALVSDMAEINRYSHDEMEITDMVTGMFAATLENLSSKTYLAGVMDFFKVLGDPERGFPKMASRIGGSLVPNVIAAQRQASDVHMDEVRTFIDRLKARTPFLNDSVNQQRNMIGEKVTKKTFTGALAAGEGLASYMLPIQWNTMGDNKLDNELADMAYPFRPPSFNKYGVDLRDYATGEGQTAYDRWQELTSTEKIKGRTLRETLKRVVNSREYQKMEQLPITQLDLDSPRVFLITTEVNKFRRAAEKKLLREFPDLRSRTLLQRSARQDLRSGRQSSSDIQSLLEGNF